MSLEERDRECLWHPFTRIVGSPTPIPIKSAKGCVLSSYDGRTYIDAISSWWTNLHGHSNQAIAEKIFKQGLTLEHVIFAGFTHEPAIELAEQLLKFLPSNQSRIFYSDNGSTAVEVALKLALQYWDNLGSPRTRFIALEGAYHGDTFGAMSVSTRGNFTKPFLPNLFDTSFIPFPSEGSEEKAITALAKALESTEVAGFIFEPLVQGVAGMRIYSEAVLSEMIALCNKRGVLTIADEVMTGFGRTGELFASNLLETKPDIICLSKGITGGFMPLAVTSTSDKVFSAFNSEDPAKMFFHGHSYTGCAISCAAALASFELLLSAECSANIKRISLRHLEFLDSLKEFDFVTNARALGTIVAFDLRCEKPSYHHPVRDIIYNEALKQGVLLRPLGNVVYILPPYCITDGELTQVYTVIKNILKALPLTGKP